MLAAFVYFKVYLPLSWKKKLFFSCGGWVKLYTQHNNNKSLTHTHAALRVFRFFFSSFLFIHFNGSILRLVACFRFFFIHIYELLSFSFMCFKLSHWNQFTFVLRKINSCWLWIKPYSSALLHIHWKHTAHGFSL